MYKRFRWAAYKCLSKLGYQHDTVDHSEHFVDPDSGTCTNLIENRWWYIKRQLPTTHPVKCYPQHTPDQMLPTTHPVKCYPQHTQSNVTHNTSGQMLPTTHTRSKTFDKHLM